MALDPGLVAYTAYRNALDYSDFALVELTTRWAALPERERVAWRACADGVLMLAETRPESCPATSSTFADSLPCGRPVGHEGWHAGFRPETGQTATWSG